MTKAKTLAHSISSLPELTKEKASSVLEFVQVRRTMLRDKARDKAREAQDFAEKNAKAALALRDDAVAAAKLRAGALHASASERLANGSTKAREFAAGARASVEERLEPVARRTAEVVACTRTGLDSAKAKTSELAANPDVRATAKSAAGGAALLGASGGAAGFTGGAAIGAALGLVPAVFTFGLSIPLGAAIGGSAGLCVGTAVGSTVGFVGGGATGGAYAKKAEIRQTTARAIKASSDYVADTVAASAGAVKSTAATAYRRANAMVGRSKE